MGSPTGQLPNNLSLGLGDMAEAPIVDNEPQPLSSDAHYGTNSSASGWRRNHHRRRDRRLWMATVPGGVDRGHRVIVVIYALLALDRERFSEQAEVTTVAELLDRWQL